MRERERKRVCACVCVCVCVCVRERERESVCVRERERECVCVRAVVARSDEYLCHLSVSDFGTMFMLQIFYCGVFRFRASLPP